MKNYEAYTIDELLTDDWFLAWAKYDQPDARLFWQEFQQKYPDRRADLLLAKDMAEAIHRRPRPLSDEQVRSEVNQIMRLTRQDRPVGMWWSLQRMARKPVAQLVMLALVLLGGLATWRWLAADSTLPENTPFATVSGPDADGWVNQVNGTSQPVLLTLPDGSQMTLQPQSHARYPVAFQGAQREIWLTGEAFFSVVHNAHRPFLVHSGSLITRVLGTRFRVHAPAGNAQITVSVQSGKVSVYDQRDLNEARRGKNRQVPGVILTANQQVVYDAQRTSYQKELVAQPRLIDPKVAPEQFEFQDTPIPTVFDRIEKNYGITIQYDAAIFRQCTLTAALAGVSLHDQLGLICASIGASYQIVDTQVVISGRGCM